MIKFNDGHLILCDYENGKDLHVVKKSNCFEYYLTDCGFPGFFQVPQRLVYTPDFKSVPELMALFAFLDDLPFES